MDSEDQAMQVKILEERLINIFGPDTDQAVNQFHERYDLLTRGIGERIVLFGAGALGSKTLTGLRNLGIEPLAIADNNPSLWNKERQGITVISPDVAVKQYGDNSLFVVTIFNGKAVRNQLIGLGCSRVLPFSILYWKYPEVFLPYGSLGDLSQISTQKDQILAALNLWQDEESREEYISQLEWRLSLDSDRLSEPRNPEGTYFPSDLLVQSDDEVFVDCGAFAGDTVQQFLNRRKNKYKQIVAIEPDPGNFALLNKNIRELPEADKEKIKCLQYALGSQEAKVSFYAEGTAGSKLSSEGSVAVDSAPLDKILNGFSPTYLKMDIEGAEIDALRGAKEIITRGSTVFAICVYHRQDDMFRVPLYIHSQSERYRYFLRRYAEDCWELVCYAIPVDRLLSIPSREYFESV